MKKKNVVTVFLIHEGRVLLLRRSREVSSYRERWAGISGYIEQETPLERAFIEVEEETGLARDKLTFLSAGLALSITDPQLDTLWIVHPFLFQTGLHKDIHLDRENTECRWLLPGEIDNLETVPCLYETLRRVLPL